MRESCPPEYAIKIFLQGKNIFLKSIDFSIKLISFRQSNLVFILNIVGKILNKWLVTENSCHKEINGYN
jgi:hypothetical protein